MRGRVFQSLPGNLPFCGVTDACVVVQHDTSFNPFQGICPSAALLAQTDHAVIFAFQSLPGNLPEASKSHRNVRGWKVS
jgi:hypothetical protein